MGDSNIYSRGEQLFLPLAHITRLDNLSGPQSIAVRPNLQLMTPICAYKKSD
jgi:hypothetical protein